MCAILNRALSCWHGGSLEITLTAFNKNLFFSLQMNQCLFPTCSVRDRILHSIFLFSILIMVSCAAITILCFKQVVIVNCIPLIKPYNIVACATISFLCFKQVVIVNYIPLINPYNIVACAAISFLCFKQVVYINPHKKVSCAAITFLCFKQVVYIKPYKKVSCTAITIFVSYAALTIFLISRQLCGKCYFCI